MSNADQVGLSFVKETTFGVTPSGPPTFTDLRFTGESFGQDTDSVTSAEIRQDRQVSGVIRTNVTAGGDLSFELSYDAYTEFMIAALQSAAFTTPVTVGPITTISAASSDNSFSDSASGFGSVLVNQWVEVRGFVDPADNGYFKVTIATAAKITVTGGTLVTEAVGPSVTVVMGGQLVNGTTQPSYALERVYEDLSSEFAILNGMTVDTMSLDITTEALITGSFGFTGKTETSATATAGDGSNTAAPTNDVMNAVDNVIKVLEDATAYGITAMSVQVANNLRPRSQVANLGPVSIGAGKVAVSGTLQAYFATKAVMVKYLDDTVTSIAVSLEDTAGNAYVIDLPRVKYSAGRRVAGGENTDIIADMSWTAFRHPTEDVTMRITRFVA